MSTVQSNPFGDGPKVQTPAPYEASAETRDATIQVAQVGQKILTSNPGFNVQPRFELIGAQGEAIFHRGTQEVIITEGLAHKCQTEAQLAAVLCHELGKMSVEREGLDHFRPRNADPGPLLDLPVGNDSKSIQGAGDTTRYMELAPYEKERQRQRTAPDDMARQLLQKAGYQAADLADVAPLLRAADKNVALENQFNGRSLPAPR
jgi:hypothetical protein